MDPQKLSQLDPKLRDAYQRVMGASTPQPQAPPSQAQTPPPTPAPTPTPAPEPKPIPPEPTPPIQEPPVPKGQPAIPQPEPAIPPKPPVQAINFDQMNSSVAAAQTSPNLTAPAPQAQTIPQKKKSSLMPILIGIAILVFIAVYALFWTKIFNLQLPFLLF